MRRGRIGRHHRSSSGAESTGHGLRPGRAHAGPGRSDGSRPSTASARGWWNRDTSRPAPHPAGRPLGWTPGSRRLRGLICVPSSLTSPPSLTSPLTSALRLLLASGVASGIPGAAGRVGWASASDGPPASASPAKKRSIMLGALRSASFSPSLWRRAKGLDAIRPLSAPVPTSLRGGPTRARFSPRRSRTPAQDRWPLSRCPGGEEADQSAPRGGICFFGPASRDGRCRQPGVPTGGGPGDRASARLRGSAPVARFVRGRCPARDRHPLGREPWADERAERLDTARGLHGSGSVAVGHAAGGELLGHPAPSGRGGDGGRFGPRAIRSQSRSTDGRSHLGLDDRSRRRGRTCRS